MSTYRHAVRIRGTAFFICICLVATAAAADTGRSVADQLVQQASASVQERYQRSLGRVAERQRDRVFLTLRQLPPPPGTVLEVVRAAQGKQAERVVARLEVLHTEAGLTECREQARTGRSHAEAGDTVRRPVGTLRLLLAPCVSLVDLAPEITDVLGEKLRAELQHTTVADLVDDPATERRAQAAYVSNAASEFVSQQTNLDEVLFPVLLQTSGKMLLNLEYYSVERGRATDIDVVSAPLDDTMRAWLRAGQSRVDAPPGFRALPQLAFAWRVIALGEGPLGALVALDADSVHVLRFQFPGLRTRWSAALGARARTRRDPWGAVVALRPMLAAGALPDLGNLTLLFSDERKPQCLAWPAEGASADAVPQLRPAPANVEPALERMWMTLRPQARRNEARWWPAPGQLPSVFLPCFQDLDQDNRPDLVWTDATGLLHVKLASQRSAHSFPGFGDAKAVQAGGGAARSSVWLTDPVWNGAMDRLHQAVLSGDDLEVAWSSAPYRGTITALASLDLNGDGVADLVVAESGDDGTRLQAFLATTGPRPRAAAPESGGRP
jgi:hypothetical protein